MNQLLEIECNGLVMGLGDRFIRIGNDVVLADLHLGKTMHFRKAGLPVPPQAREKDQMGLNRLLERENPTRLIILGDLFHSENNSEVAELAMLTSRFESTTFILVRGNHDVLSDADYRSLDLLVYDTLTIGSLVCSHEPMENVSSGLMNMHGHIHPGIRLSGKGRQSISIPCFHQSSTHFCLPAFGALTGLMRVHPKKNDKVYGLIEGSAVELQ